MEYWGAGGYHVFWRPPVEEETILTEAAPLKYHVLVGGCRPGSRILIHTGWSSDFFRVVFAGGSSDNLTTIGVEGVNRAGIGPCEEVATVLPPKPDLVVPSVSVPPVSLVTGQSFQITYEVRNDGDGTAAYRPMLRIYQSPDDTITTSDTEVANAEILAVFVGQSRTGAISLTAPSAAGTYYYGACATDNFGRESDSTNNCSEAVEVTVIG